jgi:hypothetical protein
MNEITFNEAQLRAQNAIYELAERNQLGELMIIDSAIVETESAWYFPYDSSAFVLRGDISAALAGNLPVKVPRDGTTLTYEEPDEWRS